MYVIYIYTANAWALPRTATTTINICIYTTIHMCAIYIYILCAYIYIYIHTYM